MVDTSMPGTLEQKWITVPVQVHQQVVHNHDLQTNHAILDILEAVLQAFALIIDLLEQAIFVLSSDVLVLQEMALLQRRLDDHEAGLINQCASAEATREAVGRRLEDLTGTGCQLEFQWV